MRKSLHLIVFFSIISFGLAAQSLIPMDVKSTPAPYEHVKYTGAEIPPAVPVNNNPFVFDRTDREESIGTTIYDLQTNGACQNRLVRTATGEMAGTFTFGNDVGSGYGDRGAGYNFFDGTEWGEWPTERLEDERTGWPGIALLADGSQVVLAHGTTNNELVVSRNASGSWEQSKIPSTVPSGMLWPRIVAGGADGNTIHAVAISTPIGNDGMTYEGVDGHILYYRSTDGGVNWDKIDVIIPGLDQTRFVEMDADSYVIDAEGETVAIGLFTGWGDVVTAISRDNGETWEVKTVNDFPLDLYVINSGYDTLDIPDYPDGPDNAYAILTSDGTGSVLVDHSGLVHMWFGEMYVADEDLTDAGSTFFPLWSGVRYWNENHGEDSTRVVADIVDLDGDGVFTGPANNDELGQYFTSITAFMSSGVDENDNLFLVFSALADGFVNTGATPNQQYNRHLFVTASQDGGETWLETPVDVIREETVLEPDLQPAVEAVFPGMAKMVDGKMHITYQADFEPGLSIRGDEDQATTNFINYIGVTVDEVGFGTSTEEVVDVEIFDFTVAPNPTSTEVLISYELAARSSVNLTVTNMMGQVVKNVDASNHFAGLFTTTMNVSDWAKGVYLVQFRANDKLAVQKLVVE